jgi:hypothetical protein
MDSSSLKIQPCASGRLANNQSGRGMALVRTGIKIYLSQFRAMQRAGILTPHKNLVYPLSGADFVPGYYVGKMQTYDLRLAAAGLRRGFEKMHEAITGYFPGNTPPLPAWIDFACEVKHECTNVLSNGFLGQLKEIARPGDVFLSKFMIDFLRIRENSGVVFQFVCKLIDALPLGMFVVIYEKTPKVQMTSFPSVDLGLADFLTGTGKFRDITGRVIPWPSAKTLTGGHISQAEIDEKNLFIRVRSEGQRLSFRLPLGGNLFILEKTS